MTWEYYITRNENELQELGEKGWELVSIIQENGNNKLYFKRPALSLAKRITEEQRVSNYDQLGVGD